MMDPEQVIIDAAILGLLIGVVWSLKYVVLIERRISRLEERIEHIIEHLTKKK
jgi:hypothetical protein